MAPLAAAIAYLARCPLWIQVHGVEAWHELPPLYRRAIERADMITAVSRDTRRRLLSWADIDPARVKILPNTVDPRFSPGPKPGRLLARHDLDGKKVLLTVSRLSAKERYKGHDRVLQALPQVLVSHPEAVYLIVGDGDDLSRLKTLAADLGIEKRVQFVGQIPAFDLCDYYRVADLLIMPSAAEGFGIVYLEALACGIAVITGNKDGSRDAIGDGVRGVAVDPEDVDEIARAIGRVFDHGASVRENRADLFDLQLFSNHLDGLLDATFAPD
jgi:phosphatidylinositol alpha-1,6-mannosyltransferase